MAADKELSYELDLSEMFWAKVPLLFEVVVSEQTVKTRAEHSELDSHSSIDDRIAIYRTLSN